MNSSLSKRLRSERGSGTGGVVVWAIGLSVFILVAYTVTDWIFDTKEARVERSIQTSLKKKGLDKVYVPEHHEPGGYAVEFNGIDGKQIFESRE